jgi:L-amino acid N-acyltransferase YncA
MSQSVISIRDAEAADLPRMLEIVNHSILTSTANLDSVPYVLEEKLPWFHQHKKLCKKIEISIMRRLV